MIDRERVVTPFQKLLLRTFAGVPIRPLSSLHSTHELFQYFSVLTLLVMAIGAAPITTDITAQTIGPDDGRRPAMNLEHETGNWGFD